MSCKTSFSLGPDRERITHKYMDCKEALDFLTRFNQLELFKQITITRNNFPFGSNSHRTFTSLTQPQFQCLLSCATIFALARDQGVCSTKCLENKALKSFSLQSKQ